MGRLVGNTITEGPGTGNKYGGSHKRATLRALGAAAALTLASTVAACSPAPTVSAANTASSSASATKPNAQPTDKDAYAVAVADIGQLAAACVGLGPKGKALTVRGGTPGVPTTENFYDKFAVTAQDGLTTTPDVEKAQCSTDAGSVSGHNGTGERWTMAKTTDNEGNDEVIVEHANGAHVDGRSVLRPGSHDMAPVTQAYTFMEGLMDGAVTTP